MSSLKCRLRVEWFRAQKELSISSVPFQSNSMKIVTFRKATVASVSKALSLAGFWWRLGVGNSSTNGQEGNKNLWGSQWKH